MGKTQKDREPRIPSRKAQGSLANFLHTGNQLQLRYAWSQAYRYVCLQVFFSAHAASILDVLYRAYRSLGEQARCF